MAKSSALLSLSLSFLLLFNACFGRQSFQQSPNECQLQQINAFEPTIRIEAEGGVTEFWDPYDEQFQCGGAHLYRHIIRPQGLLLPSYTNAPLVAYVLKGTWSGEFGIVVPGCAETYQSFQQSEQGQSFLDRHQKIGSYKQGDIIVFPESAAHWLYNSGREETILVVLQDTSNDANQLDANPLRFFLAGSSQESQGIRRGQRQQGQHSSRQGEQQEQYGSRQGQQQEQHSSRQGQQQGQEGQQQGQHQQHSSQQEVSQRLQEQLGYNGNILAGLDIQIVKDALNTDIETAQRIVGERSQERGHIITVEKELQLIVPTSSRSEQRQSGQSGRQGSSNGLEETVCTARVRQNIDNPARADIYDPQAGRFTTLNRFTLPIFQFVRLSAARGYLNRNWGIVPKWSMNAHSFVYVTRGSARVQIVNHNGDTVLDQEVQEGQLFLVPQDFVVVKQAGEQGFEWVEFNTHENAMFNTLSGRTSTLAGLPADIIAASYQLSSSKAQSLKRNMVSTWFFQASSSGGSWPSSSAGRSAFM